MSSATVDPITLAGGLPELLGQTGALEIVTSAVAVFDADGRLVYANPAFQHLDRTLLDSAEDRRGNTGLSASRTLQDALGASLANGTGQYVAGTFYYGPRIPVDLTLALRPLRSAADGRLCGLLLAIAEESIEFGNHHLARLQEHAREMAARIRTLSRQQADNDRLLRALMRETPFPIMLINRKRQVIQVNHAAEALLGTSARSMTAHTCDEYLDCHRRRNGCPLLDRDEELRLAETTATCTGGQDVHLLHSAVILDADGEPLILEAFVDISARKRAEGEIRRLSESNWLLLESTGEGIFGVDRELRITFANRAAARMLGYTPGELLGRDTHGLIHHSRENGTPLRREQLPISQCITLDISRRADDEVMWRKDGTPIPVEYLCNPVHEDGVVTGAVVVYRDVAEARAMARKMDYLATHDALTGLVNRHEFERRLERALSAARHDGDRHVLCYVDLDQFKVVNDTCGHAAGDELLRQLTSVLHNRVRPGDTLARLGGDEFGLLMEGCDIDTGRAAADTLRTEIEEFRFVWEERTFVIGASMGLTVIDATIPDVGAALGAADSACYMAKERGRNRVHVYEAHDADIARRHGEMQWVSRIQDALAHDGLQLYSQPIVPVNQPAATNRCVEILVRMSESASGLILPGAFIPAAERYGLMGAVDRWVIGATFAWLRRQRHRLHDLEMCSINLSGQSLGDERLLEHIVDQLALHGVAGSQICFEITETAAVANLSRAIGFIRTLKELGCRFALDDFGSGMSSFGYLKNLPVDFLKIDGNFVRDMAVDRVDYAMVEAIHQVGSVMGIRTIAEFVEDEGILACLARIGVDYAQGFGIAKPRPVAEFAPDLRGAAGHAG